MVFFLWVAPSLIEILVYRDGSNVRQWGSFLILSCEQTVWLCILLFVSIIPAFGEEFGWRGYMLPRLAQQLTARKAVIVHAAIWWVWHLPLLVGDTVKSGGTFIDVVLLIIFSFPAILMG